MCDDHPPCLKYANSDKFTEEETKQRKYLGCTPGEEQDSMGGRGMDGLYDRPHYAIHGSLLFLARFSCTEFPEVTWMSIPQIFNFLHDVKHPQPQTTTPSHLTYDSATSSRVKTCRRRIVRRINRRIHARIEASKQFWMAMLSHLRRCFDRGCLFNPIQFFSVKL